MNKRAADYLGLPQDHPLRFGIDIGAQWDAHIQLLHPNDQEESRTVWSSCLRTGEAAEFSQRVRNVQGGYRWFLSCAEPLRASDGTLLLWVGVNLDIEELKRAEQALRESEYKLRQIIETVPSLLWSLGPDGEPTYANQRILDYAGMRLEDFKNRIWQRFLHPDDLPETVKAFDHAIQTGTSYEAVHRLRAADGEYRWHHVRGEPLRDREGRIVQWYGVSIDIDERKRAEEALRESEEKFREYAETASDWFWETDPDHKFTGFPERDRLRALGFQPVSRIGLTRWDFALDVEAEPEKWRLHRSMLEARQPFRDFVYPAALTNGSVMYIKTSGKPYYDPKGAFLGYRGTGADVTATVRAQEEHERLRQLESDLAHMNRLSMMGELAASLAHEITQPIAAARNNARAALNFLD